MQEVRKFCPMCNKEHVLELTEEEAVGLVQKYNIEGMLIQDALPTLDASEREFIKTGYCSNCQEILFGAPSSERIKPV